MFNKDENNLNLKSLLLKKKCVKSFRRFLLGKKLIKQLTPSAKIVLMTFDWVINDFGLRLSSLTRPHCPCSFSETKSLYIFYPISSFLNNSVEMVSGSVGFDTTL